MAFRRERERFERIDVPRYNPYRNQIAIGILVVVGIGLAILVSVLWGKANDAARTKNASIAASVEAQPTASPAEGYVATGDVMSSYLVLVVDDVNTSSPQLASVRIMAMDATARTGVIANVPLDTKVNDGTNDLTVQQLFAEQGSKGLVGPLAAATGVKVTHVLVTNEVFWQQVEQMSGSGTKALLDNASGLLNNVNTDMSTGDIMDMAELMQSIGLDNMQRVDAPVAQEDDGNGGTWSVVDATSLCVSLGLLVAAG